MSVSSSSRISGIDQALRRPGGKRESRMRGSLDGLGSGVGGVDGGQPDVEPEVPEVVVIGVVGSVVVSVVSELPELGPEARPEVAGTDVVERVGASVMSEHDADLSRAYNPDPGRAAAEAGRAGLTGGGGTRKSASSATTIFFLGVSVGGDF